VATVVLGLGSGLELDTTRFELRRAGTVVPMEPQAFDVLAYLVSHRERLVAKEELMDEVWGGRFVTEAAVTSRIKQARRALGDDGRSQLFIRTVHGRGYRFVATVVVGAQADGSAGDGDRARTEQMPEPRSGVESPIRFTESDGLHIAYQVTGEGEHDIVLIPGFVSHLELDWGDPRHAHFLDRLGTMGRLVRFDKRGTGMSDRPPGVPDLETRIHDVIAVMDAVGSRRATLVGYSEGGAMSVLMAATHPERVSSLVLYGCYAKRTWAPDYPWAVKATEHVAYWERVISTWDWAGDCLRRCPSADDAMQRWWAQRMRASATPSTIRALLTMNALVDVRAVLPAVRAPTLVLHRTGDQLFSVEEARYLATHIPSAQLQLLDGADHLPCGDPDQILDAVETFLEVHRAHDRGDADHHETPVLAALATLAGRDAETGRRLAMTLTGGGGRLRHDESGRPLVLFDGPVAAVRAGLAVLGSEAPEEKARISLTIAEVRPDAEPVSGRAVDFGHRLLEATAPGTLTVSTAVEMLLAGSGVAVEPCGTTERGEPVGRVVPA
jgi:pimeloyl-ACP methyl ester carboxylesterase/DNA-binding winged helix-turn-helix (wHTH) protein